MSNVDPSVIIVPSDRKNRGEEFVDTTKVFKHMYTQTKRKEPYSITNGLFSLCLYSGIRDRQTDREFFIFLDNSITLSFK